MRHRVALKSDEPRLLHLLDLCPCQIARIGVGKIIDKEDGCLESVFFQNGVGIGVVVIVAVIEGDDDGLFGQRGAVLGGIQHLVDGDGRVALCCEIVHLRCELFRVKGERVAVLVFDLMVVEDGHTWRTAYVQGSGSNENAGDGEEKQ